MFERLFFIIGSDVRHRDSTFPPEARSIGGSLASDTSVEWKRLSDIFSENHHLFSGAIGNRNVSSVACA